jgi:hypothetical protein
MAELRQQGSFSIEGDDAVSAAPLPQRGVPGSTQPAAVAPGIGISSAGVSDANLRTFKAIADLSSGMLAPKIKEAAQEKFISGVQKAMTGQALDEIIKEQPWYTDIFAPSAALAGARTYTAQQAVAQWAGRMQEQMPELAKAGPEQLRSAANGALTGFLTGDAAADSLITAGVVEQMAPLFKQHAKEHYIYVQKQASAAQIGSWEAAAKVYQGFAAAEATGKGTVSPADREAAKARLVASLTPFADQSDESYERNVKNFLEGAAAQGSFHVVKLFKESGLYDRIDPDKRAELDRNLRVFGRQTLDKAMPAFAVDIAKLVTDTAQDPHSIPQKVLALNARAAATTGVTEADLIPLNSLDNIIGNVIRSQQSDAAAAARKRASELEKFTEALQSKATAQSQIALGPGYVDRCVQTGICKETDVEEVGYSMYLQAKTPQDRARILNARTGKPFDTVKTLFTDAIRSEEYNKGVPGMAQVYQGLEDNVKPHYFNEHERQIMDRFTAQVRAGVPEDAAWVSARNSVGGAVLPAESKDQLTKLIRSEVESSHENMFGRNQVTDASLRTIEAAVSKTYKLDRANATPEVAVKRALAQAKANGLEVVGKHAVLNAAGRPNRPLFTVVGESEAGTNEAFDAIMEQKAKAVGATLADYEIIRLPDRGNRAEYSVTAYDAEYRTVHWTINSEELKAAVVNTIRTKRDAPSVFGGGGAAFGIYPKP